MNDPYLIAIVICVLLIVLLGIVFFLVQRAKQKTIATAISGQSNDLSIDVTQLDANPPTGMPPKLQLVGVDSKLVVLVLAPRGNSVQFPSSDELHSLVDRISPGFSKVLDVHQPVFRRWPVQMSFEGFTNAFAYNMKLPGDSGKGTPWSTLVGRITVPGGQLFVGLVCLSSTPNEMGQIIVEHEGKWTDSLRAIG